jgi:hypothetical protein
MCMDVCHASELLPITMHLKAEHMLHLLPLLEPASRAHARAIWGARAHGGFAEDTDFGIALSMQ